MGFSLEAPGVAEFTEGRGVLGAVGSGQWGVGANEDSVSILQDKKLWRWVVGMLAHAVTVLHAVELYTLRHLKWHILGSVLLYFFFFLNVSCTQGSRSLRLAAPCSYPVWGREY